jgi:two-component system response regulator
MKDRLEILLVEDIPSDVRLTEEALKDAGLNYNLSVAGDGEEAMAFLERAKAGNGVPHPDIILLDLNMPRKNGHEVLAEIKDDPELARIPVVLLTVSQQDHDILEALRLKMNYYLSKPVASEKLAVLLKAIFELNTEDAQLSTGLMNESEDLHVRLVLASNPHTASIVLRRLASEETVRIRCRVAENPNTPPEVLLGLSKDEHAEVRLSVAENPSAPKSVLELLSKDESDDVRLGLAENPHIPADILQNLAADKNIFVASSAAKTLSNTGSSVI